LPVVTSKPAIRVCVVAAEGLRGPEGAIAALAGHSEVAATSAVSFPLLSLMSPYEAPAAA
jgi:hypothetical protein